MLSLPERKKNLFEVEFKESKNYRKHDNTQVDKNGVLLLLDERKIFCNNVYEIWP